MSIKIVFLPGDGVGPEVAAGARQVLEAASERFSLGLSFDTHDFGGIAIDNHNDPFPQSTREACLAADAIFLGAVGGPKWDGGELRPEGGLLSLRSELRVFSNLRPVKSYGGLEHLSPLRIDKAGGIDFVIVRELTGGIYFGKRSEGTDHATDECAYSREEVARVAKIAFETAKGRDGRLTSVDKANVLATSRLWRDTVISMHRDEYPDITLEHVLVDAMAMKLIQNPSAYDVILTENMFGDILSDEASVITGSIGLAPSASLGLGRAGLYEPIHGSAPDIAGQNKANPVGSILSAAMLLRYSVGHEESARAIEMGVLKALFEGFVTADIGGNKSCSDVAEYITAQI